MSKLHDKQRYLEQTASGKSHRQIAKQRHWSVSPTIIRDELIRDGMIVQTGLKMDKKTKKNFVYYTVTGKELPIETPSDRWADGTPKSRGNAFDLSIAKGLFNKSELAASQNKGKPLNYNIPIQVIAYSRA